MSLKTGLLGFAALALTATAAYSQSADTVLARYGQDPQLSAVVADEIANDPQAAGAFCAAASIQDETTQVYLGAGFADAYRVLLEGNDPTGAGVVLQIVCTCKGSASVLSSFANSVGAPAGDVCSVAWSGEYVSTVPSLFRINASGGGSGFLASMSPN